MDLSDSDIFKAKLYRYSAQSKESFVREWDEIVRATEKSETNNLQLKDVFSQYMHVLRGKERIIDRLIGLRKFYDEKSDERLKKWESVLASLKKLIWSWEYITKESKDNSILNWGIVLRAYPNVYWQYPIMSFIHNSITNNGKNVFELDKQKQKDLKLLMKETAKYCYIKWLKHRGVNEIKDTIFKVVRAISHTEDYKNIYENDLKDIKKADLKKLLSASDLGRGTTGVCLLVAVLNSKQKQLIPENYSIEHILPTKWDRYKYDNWGSKDFNTKYSKLGNLVMLEKPLNIRNSNNFFKDKKKNYKKSAIIEAKVLSKLTNWTPSEFDKRQSEIVGSLLKFLI